MDVLRVQLVEKAVNSWLESDELNNAIQRTIESSLFTLSDVQNSVRHLRNAIQRGDLQTWIKLNERSVKNLSDCTILCLHAGNLPLVGLQDALAVIISGASYAGKISKKDPFLLESFLNHLINSSPKIASQIRFSTELTDFAGLEAHYWMFAGSENSLAGIKSTLESHEIIKSGSESLLRTAHFSMAVLGTSFNNLDLVDLVESVLRYDGKGCRSVAVVYSDVELKTVADELEKIGKEWLNSNDRDFNPSVYLRWRFAYNATIGVDQVWVGNALIQSGNPVIGHNQQVSWQSLEKLSEQLHQFGSGVQQIYLCGDNSSFYKELFDEKKDYLKNSQSPPLYWRPDGIDPLEWIFTR